MDSSATSMFSTHKRSFLLVLLLAILLNIAGISIRFFTDDPVLYASLARTMALNGNFADLLYHGRDWLDKPHFPFWIIACSFKIFGINTIAYKLPALLFFFMSVIYTFKLAKKFYGDETALIAILILLTAQHTVMSNTDVRAEPYIMGLLMGAVYHFYKLKTRLSITDMLLASLFTACAVMTKGIYLLIPIGSAIIGDYFFKGNIRGVLHWKWLLSFILVVIFTLPEIYTLYTQFDLHPEKMVFGHTGISGIHWFLWDSQFGRFNNNGYIRNTHGSLLFFLHTLLWAFAPWAIILFYSLFDNVRKIIKGIKQPEYICISGGLLMLIIFSVSKFQLPFYTNILFPFFAIITAVFVQSLREGGKFKFFQITQYIISTLLVLLVVALNFIFAPEHSFIFILLIVCLGLLVRYIYKNAHTIYQPVFLLTCSVAIFINTYLIMVVYPIIVNYKGDISAAEYLNINYAGQPVAVTFSSNSFDFYNKQPVVYSNIDSILKNDDLKSRVIVADDDAINKLKNQNTPFTYIKTFDDYSRENIHLAFIIKSERESTLDHYYLIRIK